MKSRCVNPIFPALDAVTSNSNKTWSCVGGGKRSELDFCREAVDYDFAVPQNGTAKLQDGHALSRYFYHMHALGLEAWEVDAESDCQRAARNLACWTMFPRCAPGVKPGATTAYLRPCQSSCENYVNGCSVECCDESVQCVFDYAKRVEKDSGGLEVVASFGYAPEDGPSPVCTGGAAGVIPRVYLGLLLIPSFRAKGLVAALGVLAMSLQGCNPQVLDALGADQVHSLGNWRTMKDYLVESSVHVAGAESLLLNSCVQMNNPNITTCSGHGSCAPWNKTSASSFFHCKCDMDWMGPECHNRRRSQSVAFVLSCTLGVLAADQMYLGLWWVAAGKLLALIVAACIVASCRRTARPHLGRVELGVEAGAVLGVVSWYLVDCFRIGASPVYSVDHRVAADLPHWLFMSVMILGSLFLSGVAVALWSVSEIRARRLRCLQMIGDHPHGFSSYPDWSKMSGSMAHPVYGTTSV
eukprot:CAMPEP_0204262406 /NCGR_PEP_ID=MMETSP0468-20130131/7655_1 /ASSEMBLY_ACC=CAM_ASM_000383 /TAXON_ID=2969 /ORGANISM="Oxyrrhis marina" /LENGTH=468 /DNA_ID=CAMNT_0051237073 /DNA_START=140 /DNA_END=1546 /DNA_ORIENTATION=+